MGNPESLLAVLLIYAHKRMQVLGGADTVSTLQAPVSDPGDHMTYCSCSSNCTYQNKAGRPSLWPREAIVLKCAAVTSHLYQTFLPMKHSDEQNQRSRGPTLQDCVTCWS